MYVVMIAPECSPVAKVGGLADVVFGLAREIEMRGHAVELILPKYDCLRYDQIWGLHVAYQDLWVPWWGGAIRCTVWFGFVHGRKCFFIEPHSRDSYFNRQRFYGDRDDPMRFAFFSKAALEFLFKSGKRPDIIHTHDWQTALVPVLLYEIYAKLGMDRQRVVHTIHNFRHQGVVGNDILVATGLNRPDYYFALERMRDDYNASALNLTKGAILYSNFVTTVSPKHAWETRFTEQGCGLGHTLYCHQSKFGGVLNGIDYDVWNPQTDSHIPHHYDVADPQAKYGNKAALRNRLWMRDDFRPIISYVGRLDSQKGVELIRHAMFHAIGNGAQFVLLGESPDHNIGAHFWHLKHQLNDNPHCHLELRFDEELAHLVYAGSDMMVVPSLYEPCGLTQMIGLRYGAVPIVRAVGGLVDTVHDRDHAWKSWHERNGYVFDSPTNEGIMGAMNRAIGLWYDYPHEWRALMQQGMRYDNSWNFPGHHYVNIYDYVRAK
jgi:starch synthase